MNMMYSIFLQFSAVILETIGDDWDLSDAHTDL